MEQTLVVLPKSDFRAHILASDIPDVVFCSWHLELE
jgi:hypothetical protein